jgi:hypothetical protein
MVLLLCRVQREDIGGRVEVRGCEKIWLEVGNMEDLQLT